MRIYRAVRKTGICDECHCPIEFRENYFTVDQKPRYADEKRYKCRCERCARKVSENSVNYLFHELKGREENITSPFKESRDKNRRNTVCFL